MSCEDDVQKQEWEKFLDQQTKQVIREGERTLTGDLAAVRAADARVARAYAEQEAKRSEWEWKHISLDERIAKARESFLKGMSWVEAHPYFPDFAGIIIASLRKTDFRDGKAVQKLCEGLDLFRKQMKDTFPLDNPEYWSGYMLLCTAATDCNRLASDLIRSW